MSNSFGPVESLAADQLSAEHGVHIGEWSTSSDRGVELQIGDGPQVSLPCKDAVKLAQVLLTVAAQAGIARRFVTGASFLGSDPGPARTIWLLDAEPLT